MIGRQWQSWLADRSHWRPQLQKHAGLANGDGMPAPAAAPHLAALQAGTIALTCLLTVVLSIANGKSPILHGRLPDSDDYMRMVQVFGWLDGAGWWGRILPRLNPPTGTLINWARFADIPYAAITGSLEPWMGRARAALIAAAVVPPLLQLPIFLYCMNWLARPVVGRKIALLCGPLAMLSANVFIQFVPGRTDHHSWHIIFSALGLAALVRIALRPRSHGAALVASVTFALALWLGGESLPWLAAFNLGLCLIWILQGRAVVNSAMVFAFALSVLCAIVLPLAQPPDARLNIVCDDFGVFYASLPVFMLAFWGGLWLLGRNAGNGWVRLGLAAACASIGGLALFALFPECRGGPYGQLDPRLGEVWLKHTGEMLSLEAFSGGPWRSLLLVFGPLAAAIVAVVQAVRVRGAGRGVWLAFACFLFPALAISFFHVQVLPHAFVFSIVPMVWLAGKITDRAGRWRRLVSRPTIIALLYCAVLVVAPDVVDALSAAPKAGNEGARCDIRGISPVLADPDGLGARTRLIAAPIDNGAELLFVAPHNVLAAPFERDATGNLDLFDFFAARREEDARAIAKRRNIELVLYCPSAIAMWLPDDPQIFLNKLKNGQSPDWLRQIPLPRESGVRLYEVWGLSG